MDYGTFQGLRRHGNAGMLCGGNGYAENYQKRNQMQEMWRYHRKQNCP